MKWFAWVAVIAVGLSTTVYAEPIQVEFTGVIEEDFISPLSPDYFGILPGDAFRCVLTYDPETLVSSVVDSEYEFYEEELPMGEVGIELYVDSDEGLAICTDPENDYYQIQVYDSEASSKPGRMVVLTYLYTYLPGQIFSIQIRLYDSVNPIDLLGGAFPDIDVTDYTGGQVVVLALDSGLYYGFTGEIASIAILNQGPSLIEVPIDIKPGSDRNRINLDSKGVVPVAVYGTEEFDVAWILDPMTLVLFDVRSETCEGASPVRWVVKDLNGDGYNDMLLLFSTRDLARYFDETSEQAGLMGTIVGDDLMGGLDVIDPFRKARGKHKMDHHRHSQPKAKKGGR